VSTRLSLPDDPVLPQLARALDAASMAVQFDAALQGHGLRVERCSVDRVKYRPRRNCSIAYRLWLRDGSSGEGFEQRVATRLCSADEVGRRHQRAAAGAWQASPAGPSMQRLPDMDQLAWWWPNDAKLRAPRVLGDERELRERWLPELLAALDGEGATLAAHRLEVVQYVPEQRLTARVELRWSRDGAARSCCVYAKSSREPDAAVVHDMLRTLQDCAASRAGRLHTPRALLWQAQTQLHWLQAVPGRALLDLPPAQAAALAQPLGLQLAALHGTPVDGARLLKPGALRARLGEVASLLADALPASRRPLARAAERLAHGLHWIQNQPAATLHGDLHPRNVLADDGRLGLIDLDGLCRGPALLELGSWWAEGIYRAVLDGDAPLRDAAQWEALLGGYVQGGGTPPAAPALAWAAAWQLLTQRAFRCVVNLKPGRFAIAPRLIELSAELAGATLQEAA